MTDKPNLRRIKTPLFRMSFPALLTPQQPKDGGKPSFGLSMLFPPGFDKTPFMTAFSYAMEDKYGTDRLKWPKLKRKPADVIRDFGEFNSEANKPLAGEWDGWTMVRARASESHPPGVVGQIKGANGKFPVITDAREIYGGRWAKAMLEAFVYDRPDGKGVSLSIINVQLGKHDTKFGGAISAPEDDFSDMTPEEAGAADAFDGGASTAGDEPW